MVVCWLQRNGFCMAYGMPCPNVDLCSCWVSVSLLFVWRSEPIGIGSTHCLDHFATTSFTVSNVVVSAASRIFALVVLFRLCLLIYTSLFVALTGIVTCASRPFCWWCGRYLSWPRTFKSDHPSMSTYVHSCQPTQRPLHTHPTDIFMAMAV